MKAFGGEEKKQCRPSYFIQETFCLDPSVVDPDPELLPDPDSARMKEEKN